MLRQIFGQRDSRIQVIFHSLSANNVTNFVTPVASSFIQMERTRKTRLVVFVSVPQKIFIQFSSRYDCVGRQFHPRLNGNRSSAATCSRPVLNRTATEKVTMVPKQIHQGNSMTGSHCGCL